MIDKWYYSNFAECIGAGLGLGLGLGLAAIGLCYLDVKYGYKNEKIDVQILQKMDINENDIPDKFYLINGKVAVTELDGMPFSISLDTKILEEK